MFQVFILLNADDAEHTDKRRFIFFKTINYLRSSACSASSAFSNTEVLTEL